MEIVIEHGDWGNAVPSDIQRLLEDVLDQVFRHLGDPPKGKIRVQCRPSEPAPRILYRNSADEDYIIWLTVQNNYWSRYAYQFSHELCHLISCFERLRRSPNQWFHESICELASIFSLKQMSETWQISPPYTNWFDYAPFLNIYAEEIVRSDQHQLPVGVSLAEWFLVNEASLRINQYQRPLNSLVAIQLLPLLQACPQDWESIRHMPDTDECFQLFLSLWHASVPNPHKQFVLQIAKAFGIAVT